MKKTGHSPKFLNLVLFTIPAIYCPTVFVHQIRRCNNKIDGSVYIEERQRLGKANWPSPHLLAVR